jgi:phenylacetate-CoA ligase
VTFKKLFWNAQDRTPECRFFSAAEQDALDRAAEEELPRLLAAPYQDSGFIAARQAERIAELLNEAARCAVYAPLYGCAGVSPRDFKGLADLQRFPIVSKQDMLRNYPAGFPRLQDTSAPRFKTYSSGSTSLTLPVHFPLEAVITDTLMGARQLILQSDGAVDPDDVSVHYYTYPWWTDQIANKWRAFFLSSFNTPQEAREILGGLKPAVVTGYASLISALAKEGAADVIAPKLVGVNSEQSTREERQYLRAKFNCPVLDEYSSEELTRIAYELADGFYYVNEDCVYLEVLDQVTRKPTANGEWGEAVITGLLNNVMPFVRYATGDLVRRPKSQASTYGGVKWSRLDGIGGRMMDSFVRRDGSVVPSGTVLDIMYRAIADTDAAVARYCLVQHSPMEVVLEMEMAEFARPADRADVVASVTRSLALVMQETVALKVEEIVQPRSGKRRCVRSEIGA